MSDEKIKALLDQCAALEEGAGITKKVQKAEDGRFIPLGIGGENCSSDEYFADEHDHFREQIRDAYFSVPDRELRMALIAARRRVDSELAQSFERDASAARRAEASTAQKAEIRPWGLAAVLSLASVAVGQLVFQLPGAIAGAIAGYFLGNGVIQSARIRVASVHRIAQEELQTALDNLARSKLHPECFTHDEQHNGERDDAFNMQSAIANVLGSQDTANNSFKPIPHHGSA